MRRIVKIGIALFAAIVVLGLVGCSEPSPKKPPVGPSVSSDATLTQVKFGDEIATLGTPAATYAGATAGSVNILEATVNITATPANEDATIEYAQVAVGEDGELGEFDEASLWSDITFTFKTGDVLVIKVTAQDGTTVKYYKIGVTLLDVALASLTVGGIDITLPAGGTSWQTTRSAAYVLFTYLVSEQPADGIEIVATAEQDDATIQYAKYTQGGAAPVFGNTSSFVFADSDFVYIKVTSADGAIAYYKAQISFKRSGRIKYGSPNIAQWTLDNGVLKPNPNAQYKGVLDTIWNDPSLEEYPIDRIYAPQSAQLLDPANNLLDENGKCKTTQAFVKALWDEEGLSVYVRVIDSDMSETDNEHNTDSFELFVNEDLSFGGTGAQKYSNGGSQYRVAANGQRSGEGGSPAAMNALNKTSVWKTSDGYIIVMKAPWRLWSKFFSPTTYRNDWEFGFELQLKI